MSYGIISNVISALVDLYGWRRTYPTLAALLVSYPLLAFVLLRSRPEDIGLFPDGDAPADHASGSATRGLQAASSLDDGNEDEAEKEASGHGPPDGGGCVVDDGSFRCTGNEDSCLPLVWLPRVGVGSGLFFNLSSITHEAGLLTGRRPPTCTPRGPFAAAGMAASGYMLDHFSLGSSYAPGSCWRAVASSCSAHRWESHSPRSWRSSSGCCTVRATAVPRSSSRRARHLLWADAWRDRRAALDAQCGQHCDWALLVGASFDLLGTYAPCVRGIALASATMAIVCLGMHRPVKPSSGGAGEELGRADCVSDGPDPPKDSALEVVADPDAAPTPSTDLLAGEELDSNLPSVHQDAVAVAMEEPCANDIVAESPEKLDPACSRMKRSSTRSRWHTPSYNEACLESRRMHRTAECVFILTTWTHHPIIPSRETHCIGILLRDRTSTDAPVRFRWFRSRPDPGPGVGHAMPLLAIAVQLAVVLVAQSTDVVRP